VQTPLTERSSHRFPQPSTLKGHRNDRISGIPTTPLPMASQRGGVRAMEQRSASAQLSDPHTWTGFAARRQRWPAQRAPPCILKKDPLNPQSTPSHDTEYHSSVVLHLLSCLIHIHGHKVCRRRRWPAQRAPPCILKKDPPQHPIYSLP